MKALNSFIVVLPIVPEKQQSASGLLLTGSEAIKQRYQKAEVVVACDGQDVVNQGDIIAYDAVQGHDYRIGDVMYRIIQYRDVALIL